MDVLVVAPYARMRPHFETDLELAQLHLDQGDHVDMLVCEGNLAACDMNPEHGPVDCWKCMCRSKRGIKLLRGAVHSIPLPTLSDSDRQRLAGLPEVFASIDELKQVTIDNFDLGYAVVSSIASLTRNPEFDPATNADLIRRMAESSWAVYCGVIGQLQERSYDRVYVFNGRLAILRAALRACQQMGVSCLTHERGRDFRHFALYRNTMPHDMEYVDSLIRSAWSSAPQPEQRAELAADWFLRRAAGAETNWTSFVARQDTERLPRQWDSKQRNVAIFTSSEDEFVAIGDSWQATLYPTQLDGLRRILADLATLPDDMHFYVRMHPNLAGIDNRSTRDMLSFQHERVTVIPPEDVIDSYALMKAAEKVVTFGSTAGIEAVFWGTPSILLGRSFYERLGGNYQPASHEDMLQLLRDKLEPREIEPALVYGYFWATLGQPFRHFEPRDLIRGTFNGRKLRLDLATRTRIQLYRLLRPLLRA